MNGRRRRWLVTLVAVAVVLSCSGDAELGSPRRRLAGFRIEYRVEVFAPDPVTSRRVVRVRRPFDGRDDTFADEGSEPDSSVQVVGTQVFSRQGDSVLALGPQLPHAPPGDIRLDLELADAVRLGLARRRPDLDTSVAGRPCRMYRFGSPLGDPLRPLSAGEHADLCIDGDGLVLSESWRVDGELLRRTTAVRVETKAPPATALAPPADAEPDPTSAAEVEPLDLTVAPDTGATYWVVDEPPWGFALAARVRAGRANLSAGTPAVEDVAYVDTYRRRSDFIAVEHRERSLAGEPQPGMEEVDGGRLGPGQLVLTPGGPEVTFEVDGSVVTVRGTVPVRHLLDFARRLRAA